MDIKREALCTEAAGGRHVSFYSQRDALFPVAPN